MVSLRLEPRTISATAQYAANLRVSQELELTKEEMQARYQNSFKPGRIRSKKPLAEPPELRESRKSIRRGNTLAGHKVALQPQPRDLRKHWHLKKKDKPVKAESGSQTAAG